MKVLTAAQMREVDRRTVELGIPGIVLMENAGHRVVEFLERRCAPLAAQRVAILCGKGNNGGDGLVIARQLYTRVRPAALYVVLFCSDDELRGDAAENIRMLHACGCPVLREIPAAARNSTLVVDALLGTGVNGPATGRVFEALREINSGFPLARVCAVDMPSGMPSDSGEPTGEIARADYTVTFTAPKLGQVLAPNCDCVGELAVCPIGSAPELYEKDASIFLSLIEPSMFRHLLGPRPPSGHKGTFGHVLLVAGSRGKTGAAAMSGMASLRAGAGLVTVASAASAIPIIAGHAAELMTEPLEENESGGISKNAPIERLAEGMTVIAMGPGMGRHPDTEALVTRATAELAQPMVIDADALTAKIQGGGKVRVMTPHPGEMSRLTGTSIAEVQKDRVGVARSFATEHGVALVLKGQRTIIAFPDGTVWINPTGTPALGKGGTGDVLTGLIAGFLAQFPHDWRNALAAAVYLGGLAGQIGARELGDKSLLATDQFRYLPQAMEECAAVPHGV
ncbi:MAG TPA: NAD(P)H-hydrate dehydratase [Bryobacteraceae bacterium]|jgi:NAD(P)H-hydrate epimerase|nr:NAD(P)H-hydrate dehydratase [Bryobacteraceae bacterium]